MHPNARIQNFVSNLATFWEGWGKIYWSFYLKQKSPFCLHLVFSGGGKTYRPFYLKWKSPFCFHLAFSGVDVNAQPFYGNT